MTARALIIEALEELGVLGPGEPLAAADAATALSRLNGVLNTLQLDPLMVSVLAREVFSTVAGQASYTIGPGGHWPTSARPDVIQRVGVVTGVGADAVEHLIGEPITDDRFATIQLKGATSTWPQAAHYTRSFPLGVVTLWPVPADASVSIAVYERRPSHQGTLTLNTELALAPGWPEFLRYTLARRLATPFHATVTQELRDLERSARLHIQGSNVVVDRAECDPALVAGRARPYNILTGE